MQKREDCVIGARNMVEIDNLKAAYNELSAKIDLIFDKLESLRREVTGRAPFWATMVISGLMGAVGFLLSQCINLITKGGV